MGFGLNQLKKFVTSGDRAKEPDADHVGTSATAVGAQPATATAVAPAKSSAAVATAPAAPAKATTGTTTPKLATPVTAGAPVAKTGATTAAATAAKAGTPAAPAAASIVAKGPAKVGTKTAATAKGKAAAPVAKPCPNCGSTDGWGISPWCPKCFYHPKLGTFFVESAKEEQEPPPPPPPENYRDFVKALPPWAITLGGGALGIVVFNVMLAFTLPEEGWARPIVAILELVAGITAVLVVHAIVFMEVVPKTDRYSAADFFLKPIEIWKLTFHNLPLNAWRVWQLGWGLTGMVCAATFVGGIHYSAAFDDWGFQKRAAMNVVHTIKERVRESKEEEASKKPIVLGQKTEKEALAALPHADCVIIGYMASTSDGFSSVLLATEVNGKLAYAGTLPSNEFPPEVRATLAARLPLLRQPEPLLKGFKTTMPAMWLRPVLMCRIAYRKTPVEGNFANMRFREMLADLAQ